MVDATIRSAMHRAARALGALAKRVRVRRAVIAALAAPALTMCSQAGTGDQTADAGADLAGRDGSGESDAGRGVPAQSDAGEGVPGTNDAGENEAGARDAGWNDAGANEARAPDSGQTMLGLDPAMGWSSWSFIRYNPTEADIKAQAQALHDSGLQTHGFTYVNIDDFYYLDPLTNVDSYGRWVVDSTKFPDGMASVASLIHGLGLKFGMYVTPGVPAAAVNRKTPIEGTSYTAADIAVSGSFERNYNFHDNCMLSIDYSKPGAQQFINSWAKLLVSYGVDYLKIDGVGSFDLPDVQAWSEALRSSGRTIHFELSNQLAIGFGSSWASLSNGWRIDNDIECYCSTITTWSYVSARFTDLPPWQPFSGSGARNDLDSLEVGNGDKVGLTLAERQTQMSLWALAAAPLLLGVDLTNLDSGDLALLKNDEVIAIDQAGVAAKQLTSGNSQVWVAAEPDGAFAVGLFNLGSATTPITIKWSDLGISGAADVRDLWAQKDLGTMTGSFTSNVSSHGVTLVRIQR